MPSTHTLHAAVEHLGRLIAFPTVSSDSNLALIAYAAEHLERLGARIRLDHDATANKANLFATLGSEQDGGIVLSGHSDVVPVAGQAWHSDPFQMLARDDKLYGRGSCDMKGFIACCLAMAPDFAGLTPSRPLHIALTYDEETGCLGGKALIDTLRRQGLQPALCWVGEPTGMKLIEGHKGCCHYTTEFIGLGVHSSKPERGVNAVEYAVQFAVKLLQLRDALKTRCPADSRFTPPYSTLQLGRLQGGIAHNVIPNQASLAWEIRPISAADGDYVREAITRYARETLCPEMQRTHPDADIVTHTIGEVAGLAPEPASAALAMMAELTGQTHADMVAFATEAGLFQAYGVSTIICGPGAIEQAHQPDEFVSRRQLADCLDVLEKLKPQLTA